MSQKTISYLEEQRQQLLKQAEKEFGEDYMKQIHDLLDESPPTQQDQFLEPEPEVRINHKGAFYASKG